MAGKKGRSGRKTAMHEFNALCMLSTAAGILENAMKCENTPVSRPEKQRQHLATEVFKKLAPSKIELEGEVKHTGIIFQRPDGTVIKL